MKRLLVVYLGIAFVLILFTSGFVSAQTCDPDQIIFKISATSNAHAEIWNPPLPLYTNKLCFNNFFAGTYVPPPGGDPHAQSGNNIVIKLSAPTNAHLEDASFPGPGGFNNPTSVYYGDLICEVRELTAPGRCSDVGGRPGTTIGYLSGRTNAHFLRGEVNRNYPFALCCSSESTPNPSCLNSVWEPPGEECDPTAPDPISATCELLVPGTSGTVGCTNECTFDTGACQPEPDPFCTEYVISRGTTVLINNVATRPTSCDNFNDITETDFGTMTASVPYLPGYLAFKEEMCASCHNLFLSPTELLRQCGVPGCSNARCVWDPTSSPRGCQLVFDPPGGGGPCTQRVVGTPPDCAQGQAFRDVTYEITGPPECNPGTYTWPTPCPRVVQLPFFNSMNFLISLIAIAIIYFIYFNVKRKKK